MKTLITVVIVVSGIITGITHGPEIAANVSNAPTMSNPISEKFGDATRTVNKARDYLDTDTAELIGAR